MIIAKGAEVAPSHTGARGTCRECRRKLVLEAHDKFDHVGYIGGWYWAGNCVCGNRIFFDHGSLYELRRLVRKFSGL
jgi:hypothetical protein